MKTLKSISKMLVLATVLLSVSCSSDDDAAPVIPTGGNYYVKAKVDGASYANSSYVTPRATLSAGTLNIQSSDNSGNAMQIQIPGYHGVGTYNSGDGDITDGYINFMKRGPGFTFHTYTSVRGTGVVNITLADDTTIEGTFSATAPENDEDSTASVIITEGTFKLKKP